MDDNIFRILENKFPCRSEILANLINFVGNINDAFPAAIFMYGHSGTGKTAITKEFLRQYNKNPKMRTVHLNCVEAYSSKILFETILENILTDSQQRCETLNEFIDIIRHSGRFHNYIIILDSANRLRDMDANILPAFLQLPKLTGLNICVILISQIPIEKFYCKTGLGEILTLFFPQYSKLETQRILCGDLENLQSEMLACIRKIDLSETEKERRIEFINLISEDFYNNYLNLFLSVFFKACRDLPELKITARKCFFIYVEPVLSGNIDATDVSRLWRNISNTLRDLLAQVYMRFERSPQDKLSSETTAEHHSQLLNPSIRQQAQSLELPYYAKYLLIAAFLASYNPAKQDKRLFVKHHGKQRKRMQTVNAKAKVSEKLSTSLGPKSFTIDRLLAIFYAILDEKVGLTCNLLSQISTLVHLKLLNFVSGENNIMDGSARLQCTVNMEFVLYIGRVVDFNVRQYLCDFI